MARGGGTTVAHADTPADAITVDTWHHIAAVREGTGTNQTKLYVDGLLKGQGTDDTDFSSNVIVKLGNYGTSATDRLSGSLDEVRVSNVARWTDTFVPPKRQYGEKSVISAEGGDASHPKGEFVKAGSSILFREVNE